MPSEMVPIFRVKDGEAAAAFYARMGFVVEHTHRFAPNLPLYTILEREGSHLHLSEHKGDAPKKSLAYFWLSPTNDIEAIAATYGLEVEDAPWAREVTVIDHDKNRLRVGERKQS